MPVRETADNKRMILDRMNCQKQLQYNWFFFSLFSSFCQQAAKPEEVLYRYNILLKHFQWTKTMSATLQKLKVDRKTVSLTAAIAEMYLAGQKEDIPDYKDGMTL